MQPGRDVVYFETHLLIIEFIIVICSIRLVRLIRLIGLIILFYISVNLVPLIRLMISINNSWTIS